MAHPNDELIQRFYSAFARGDGDTMAACYTPDARFSDPVFTDLSNPDQKSAEVDAGTIRADVVLAGTDDVVIGPASLKLGEGTTNIVYAWGSAEDDNLKLAVQTITGMHSAPGGVPGGTGGQAAEAAAVSPYVPAMIGLGLLGIVVSAAGMARARVPIAR